MLKGDGFDDWTTRKTWRRCAGRIDHVEFRSFNSYFSGSLDCTPASVSVWIGTQIPELEIDKKNAVGQIGPKGFRPVEAEMPIRGIIAPSIGLRQRNNHNIWNIESIEDAEAAAIDIALQFNSYGLNWLNSDFDVSALISFLESSETEDIQTRPNGARIWLDAGRPDSPNRNMMIAKLAVACGNFTLAAVHTERSRWALNHKTGQKYLYLPPKQDEEIRLKAVELAAKSYNPRS